MSIRKYGRYWALYDDAGELVCVCLYKKGTAEVLRRLQQLPPPPTPPGPTRHTSRPRQAAPPVPAPPLPEAPASVQVSLELCGHQGCLTLRDTDEHRLLARLEAVLTRVPGAATSHDRGPVAGREQL